MSTQDGNCPLCQRHHVYPDGHVSYIKCPCGCSFDPISRTAFAILNPDAKANIQREED